MRTNFFINANPVAAALIAAIAAVSMTLMSFVLLEPAVSFAITDVFTVEQEITAEISFETTANDVTMLPAIAGLSGGISSGTTTVAVSTNDVDGYNMTIQFADSIAMQYESGAEYIPNYNDGGSADYTYSVLTGSSSFALAASSTSIVTELRNNGSGTCGAGSFSNASRCWTMESNATTPFTLVNRATDTPAEGETTIIAFRVGVGANPDPELPAGFYNATATLTALVN